MSNIKKTLLCLFAAMVVAGPLFAVSGYEVMKQVHDKKVPSYTHTLVKMDLIEQNGTTQNRVMEEWSMDKDGKT
ncbi:MAG: outer membrane lipoprotein-sorting protein, partial [Sphaerochaetaceae bacterium]